MSQTNPASSLLETILDTYVAARTAGVGGEFGSSHPVYQSVAELARTLSALPAIQRRNHLIVRASAGQGNWARVPWVAVMDRRETTSTQQGVYVVFLFREDMSGVYLTFNQGVTQLTKLHGTLEARRILRERAAALNELLPQDAGFEVGDKIDLCTGVGLGKLYEHSTASFKLYVKYQVPPDHAINTDLEVLLSAYDTYMSSELRREFSKDVPSTADPGTPINSQDDTETPVAVTSSPPAAFSLETAMEELLAQIDGQGFVFEPWQVAQYVTAIRTKPFVILAGITGTGKSKLPQLIARATGGAVDIIPVRPDWTDSSEVLGYIDLEGSLRPGRVLEVAHAAAAEDDHSYTLIIDEMNLARVEHYFAEILSKIENRSPAAGGGWASPPLFDAALHEVDAEWGEVGLPPNLMIVGTVNMDESAYGFSRKVLDRAFTVELSDVALDRWFPAGDVRRSGMGDTGQEGRKQNTVWPASAWWPRATRLSELSEITADERERIESTIGMLVDLNTILAPAQLQVGYRTRDEIVLFLLHAEEIRSLFRTDAGEQIDPLDLAIQMKVLPRISGGGAGVRRVLLGILGWAYNGTPYDHDDEARDIIGAWNDQGRPVRLVDARFPGVAARACLMWDRLASEGFTSYWL